MGEHLTNVPINRNRACLFSGPALPLLRKAPKSVCDKRPPEGALGWWMTNA